MYKVTFVLNGPQGLGWTESWYCNAANATAALSAAVSVVPSRSAMLGTGTYISQLIATNLATQRTTRTRVVQPDSNLVPGTNSATNNDAPWMALKLRLICGGARNYHKTFALRGLQDAWTKFNFLTNQPALQGPWDPFILTWIVAMSVAVPTLTIQAFSKETGDNPAFAVTGLSVNAVPNTVTIIAPGHTYQNGNPIRVRNVVGNNLRQQYPARLKVNGKWVALNVATNQLDIGLPATTLAGTPVWESNGTVRGCKYFYPTTQDYVVTGFMRRKLGHIRYTPKGRNSNRPPNYA